MGKPISHRSDIFCLGIVLYELVCGRRPLVGNSEITLLQAIRQCRIAAPRTINPRIPEKLDRVIMKALDPDPDQRYQDAPAMQRALDHALGDHEPATEKELSRLMDVLFDADERDKTLEAASEVRDEDTGQIEVDLEGEEAPPRERPEHGTGKDDMSVEKLLQRFRGK
jgi:serine/threonine-protein kinase